MTQAIHFTINGQSASLVAPPFKRLLDLLREDLHLTGTKEGCGEGECGSCSVTLNGQLVNSCLVPAIHAHNATIQTIEGLADGQILHPLQRAFLECGGAQCGICIPGMLMAATHLLNQHPQPSMPQVKEGLAGNLCRCTGFIKIFDSVLAAALTSTQPPAANPDAR